MSPFNILLRSNCHQQIFVYVLEIFLFISQTEKVLILFFGFVLIINLTIITLQTF